MKSFTYIAAAIALSASAAVTACAPTPTYQQAVPPIAQVSISHVTGTASYRERILMPAGSTLVVKVLDVSRADAPSETISEATYTLDGGGPPYNFDLRVFMDRVDPRHTYAVRAELRDPTGRLRFTTDQRHQVLTQGAPNTADIVMVGVR